MAKKYPRKYVVVEGGKTKKVTVKDVVHEVALCLRHQEAMGLNKPEKFDDKSMRSKEG